jgi:hypothetical protein
LELGANHRNRDRRNYYNYYHGVRSRWSGQDEE